METSGRPLGATITVQQAFDLSLEWYAGRAEASWEPFSAERAQEIFARHSMSGAFWDVG